jgi:hypothetical protein
MAKDETGMSILKTGIVDVVTGVVMVTRSMKWATCTTGGVALSEGERRKPVIRIQHRLLSARLPAGEVADYGRTSTWVVVREMSSEVTSKVNFWLKTMVDASD